MDGCFDFYYTRKKYWAVYPLMDYYYCLLLTASGFVPGGSGTAVTQKTQINAQHSKQYTHKITNTIKRVYYTH
jgi:hypothetical protein